MRRAVLFAALAFAACAGARGQAKAPAQEGLCVVRDVAYGPRGDAPGEGGARAHRSGQFFDVLSDARAAVDAPVYVHLHGGAWCQPFDKDGESLAFFRRLVARGFVVVNANYQLQNDVTAPGAPPPRRARATFRDMLRDVDDLGAFLARDFLPRRGLAPRACALGGVSAGGHLALLYAYDQGNPSARGARLRHALRVDVAVAVAAPADLAGEAFVAPLFGRRAPFGTRLDAAGAARLLTLLGWLADEDLPGMRARGDEAGVRAALARFSPARLVTPRAVPTVLAYARRFPFAQSDGCVPTRDYDDLRARLERAGVPVAGALRTFRAHGALRAADMEALADQVAAFARRASRPETAKGKDETR